MAEDVLKKSKYPQWSERHYKQKRLFQANKKVQEYGLTRGHRWKTTASPAPEDVLVYDLNGNLIGEYYGDNLQATRVTVDFEPCRRNPTPCRDRAGVGQRTDQSTLRPTANSALRQNQLRHLMLETATGLLLATS
jgi:hypothetical protein